MVHNRKFQPQGSSFFGSYKQIFTVLEFVLSAFIQGGGGAFIMQLDYTIAHANCHLKTF